MIYRLRRIFKRLIKKENIFFIEGNDIEQYIIDKDAKCFECGTIINSTDDIYKIKLKRKEILFFCKSCPEE